PRDREDLAQAVAPAGLELAGVGDALPPLRPRSDVEELVPDALDRRVDEPGRQELVVSHACTMAAATSARERSESRRMYSCGAWAPPPRGPRPSTVIGIEAAKWLASLAPPRPAGTTARPSASPVRASRPAVASRESMPGQTRTSSL